MGPRESPSGRKSTLKSCTPKACFDRTEVFLGGCIKACMIEAHFQSGERERERERGGGGVPGNLPLPGNPLNL